MNKINQNGNPLLTHKKEVVNNNIEEEEQKCIICSEKLQVSNKFFASCDHRGTCVGCAQQNKYPTCIIKPQCEAKMTENQYNKSKRVFNEWKINGPKIKPVQASVRHCKQPNCKGIINWNRCTKCCTYYCEVCGELDHDYGMKCSQSTAISIEGVKQCPKCTEYYVRDEGCIHVKCPKCKFQFCQVCHNQWSRLHHACNLRLTAIKNSINQNAPNKKKTQQCCHLF